MGHIGNTVQTAFTSFDKQTITGDGTTGPYTLSHAVANEQEIEVFVNNVRQEPSVAYTASGNQLTMTGNVASTDDFYVVFQGKAVQTVVPPAGSVTDSMIVGMSSSKLTGALPALDGSALTGLAVANRNLIINGAMQVAQRGTVTGVTLGYGGPDRFVFASSGAAAVDMSQSTDVPSGSGFANSMKLDVSAADSSLAAGDYALWAQRIEGQNLQSIKKGSSNAEKLTVSFWIKSSTTGTYILEIFDSDNTRQVSASYSVSTADTWEYKVVTFPEDATGTLDSDNATSLTLTWWLAASSTFSSGTLNTAWATNNNANRAVGQVNAVNDAANNIYFTGVQLEVGDTATPFEHRSYADELFACQRYYSHAVAATGPAASSTTAIQAFATFPRQMRASPSYSVSGALNWSNGYSADFVQSTGQVNVISNNTDGSPAQFLNFANFSGLTSGTIHFFPRNSTNNNRIIADAEL